MTAADAMRAWIAARDAEQERSDREHEATRVHLEREVARLRARLAGRPTPPTHAEVAALTARCGHRQALRASVWRVACRSDAEIVMLYAEENGEIVVTRIGRTSYLQDAIEHDRITRWWPLDGATMEPTDWPDAGTP